MKVPFNDSIEITDRGDYQYAITYDNGSEKIVNGKSLEVAGTVAMGALIAPWALWGAIGLGTILAAAAPFAVVGALLEKSGVDID